MDFKKKINNYKNIFIQKYWPDPVWSKIISAVFIGIGTGFFVIVKSLYEKISIKSAAQPIIKYFNSRTELNNMLLWFGLFIIYWALFVFIKLLLGILRKKYLTKDVPQELPTIYEPSTVFYFNRLTGAFPGQRGLKWYNSKTAVERLKIVFKEPINFKQNIDSEFPSDPLWWFRGHSSMFIKEFKQLSSTKILLETKELEINRIAVYLSESYHKCFIYVECVGEKQIGLNNYTAKEIQESIEERGFCNEEYALLGKKPISREHYDDGATIINGKVVESFGAKLRVRYLSDYNFIIAAKKSPYNSRQFEIFSAEYFDKINKKIIDPEVFLKLLETYSRHEV